MLSVCAQKARAQHKLNAKVNEICYIPQGEAATVALQRATNPQG